MNASNVLAEPISPQVYINVINDLQQLESRSLCHRLAIYSLVVNCKVIDGQETLDATGQGLQHLQDTLDSSAINLAMCDLERARADIPRQCDKFRGDYLASLPLPSAPQLHVTSQEISNCMNMLGSIVTAWTSFTTYKAQAKQFCEAARVDLEKGMSFDPTGRLSF